MVGVVLVQTAVAAFTLLVLSNALEQMHSAEVRPQCRSYVNLGVRQLPQEKVTQAHLAAGAHDQVRIGQVLGVKMTSDRFFVDLQMVESAIARRCVSQWTEGVDNLGARAVIER